MPKDPRGYITVHDGMPNHPKVEPLTDKAFRLLITSWCYCAANNTDGHIRQVVWERRSTAKARQELLDAGLVLLADDGVQMRDYLQHQRSAAERAALREKRANAGKLGGRAKANAKQEPGNDAASATPVAKQTPSKLAIYTEAEAETEMTTSSRTPAPRTPDAFDEFWAAYPRKDDKTRARKAWATAARANNPQVILAGAARYRDDPNRDDAYTKQAATWLNAGSWENGPLPARGGRPTTESRVHGALALAERFRAAEQPALEGPR